MDQARDGRLAGGQERFEALFNGLPDAIFLADPESGVLLDANPAACRLTGRAREQLVGMHQSLLHPAGERERIAVAFRRHAQTHAIDSIPLVESLVERVDGTCVPVEIVGMPVMIQGRRVLQGVFRNVSARRQAEDALRGSEERLRLKLDSLLSPEVDVGEQDLANVIDSQALQALWQEFYSVTGMAGAVLDLAGNILVGVGWQDICTRFHRVHPETRRNCTESDLVLTRGVPRGEFRIYRCKNGMWDVVTPLYLGDKHVGNVFVGQFLYDDEQPDYAAFAARAEDCGFDREAYLDALEAVPRWSREKVEHMISFLARLTDMISRLSFSNLKLARATSDSQRAEEKVRHLNEELERRVMARTADLTDANRELESFAYAVSHDLRAPLRSIDGWSQVLDEDYGHLLGQAGRDHLGRIHAQVLRMAHLIDALLDFSRRPKGELQRVAVDLSGLALQVEEALRQRSPGRQVEFIVEPGLVVIGDPALLRVALENLLGNAWKFTGKRERARIEVGRLQDDGAEVYFVRDNGVGFDMAYASKLFLPFHRLHDEGDFQGSGIGLATTQRILQRHGGRIWAESALDRGATFFFTV
jgi:PAS domain S-box-containing protein